MIWLVQVRCSATSGTQVSPRSALRFSGTRRPEAWPVEDFVKEAKSSMDMLYRQVLLHPDMYKVFYWDLDCFVAARVRRLSPRELPVKKKTVGKLVPVKVSRSRSSRRRRTRSSS